MLDNNYIADIRPVLILLILMGLGVRFGERFDEVIYLCLVSSNILIFLKLGWDRSDCWLVYLEWNNYGSLR